MTEYKKFIIITLCFIANINIKAQDTLIYLKRVDNSKLEIYRDNKKLRDVTSSIDKVLWDVSVSSKDNYISLIERPKDLKISKKNNFKILSNNGEILHSLDKDVRKYQWNNKGNEIAMIVGSYYEGGIGFMPEEILVYNLNKRSEIYIDGELKKEGAYEISWSTDDSKLYIKTLRNFNVYEYNLKDKSLILTEYKDIYFSPDGKYYFQKYSHKYNKEFIVYDAKTNTKVDLDPKISQFDNLHQNEYGKLIGWAPNKGHALLFKKINEDVEYKDIIIQEKDENQAEIVLRDYVFS